MKTRLLLVVLFGFSTIIFSQKKPKIKGNKMLIEVNKIIDEKFNTIEIDDGLEVNLYQGNQNKYVLKTDYNLVDVIKFVVYDNTLKIYTSSKIVSKKKLELNLTVKKLEHIILKNGVKLKGKERITSDKLYVSGYSSCRFDLDVKAEDVTVTLHRNSGGKINIKSDNTTIVMNDRTDLKGDISTGKLRVTMNKSAQLNLDGESDMAIFNLKDDAELKAKNMKATSADLYTTNSSDVYLYVKKNLELYAEGRSKIYIYGDPKIEIKGLTDKSRIIKK